MLYFVPFYEVLKQVKFRKVLLVVAQDVVELSMFLEFCLAKNNL